MELFTKELTKFKNLSEKLTKNCELLETEVNLLNKLIFLEQKFSDHLLNDLFLLYEKNFINLQQNYRYYDAWDQLERQKSIAKQNETQVKRLRQELKTWRQTNHRLNDIINGDHTYSSGTDAIASVNDIAMNARIESVSQIPNQDTGTQSTTSCETQTSTIVPEVKPETSSASVSVKLEVIPKTEPEDICYPNEETDSASEGEDRTVDDDNDCIIEGVEPIPVSSDPQTSRPFLFVSEFLSKNKAFSHLIDKNKEQPIEDKTIAIDLNSDSETETTGVNPIPPAVPVPSSNSENSVFDDSIVDLTPKTPILKKSPKKSFIKKRVRFGRKRKVVKNSPIKNKETTQTKTTTSSVSDKTINTRIIGSNRKKIHFNADNTISIIELKGRAVKKSDKTEAKLISPSIDLNLSRTEKAQVNENYIKSTKKIVLKGKIYYCRWKSCSYNTEMRQNAIRHLWKHTGETPYKCELCPQGFRDKRHLSRHVMTHNAAQACDNTRGYKSRGTGTAVCPVCNGKYPHFQHLLRHMRRIHGKEKADKYKQQFYKNKSLLLNKQNTSTEGVKTKRNSIERSPKTRLESNVRSISPKKFYKKAENSPNLTKKSIEISAVNQTEGKEGVADDNNEWKCDFNSCLRSYTSKCNLKRHQLEIHNKVSKPLFYNTFNKSGKVVKYFIPKTPQKVENSPKKMKTNKSNKTSNTSKAVPKPEGTEGKGFSCNFKNCTKSFVTISGLYKHKKNVHISKTEWPSVAQKANKFKNSISAQPLVKDNTSPTASRSGKLSAKRVFFCPELECKSRFVWAKNLKTHMKEKHNTEVQPEEVKTEKQDEIFRCPYTNCPFWAASRTAQITHFRTHFSLGEKPFKCLIKGCDYGNEKLSLLKYHVLNKHSEQEFYRAMEESGVHYPSWY